MRALLILMLLALTVFAQAWLFNDPAWLAQQKAAASAGCTTVQTNVTGSTSPDIAIQGPNASSLIAYAASAFTVRANCTICSAVITNLTQANSPAWQVYVAIYTDSGVDTAGAPAGSGSPGTRIGTASGTITASTLPTSAGTPCFSTFTGMSATLTTGTKYWYVVGTSGPTRNAGETVSWKINNNYGSPQIAVTSTDGSAWTYVNNFELGAMTLYSQ